MTEEMIGFPPRSSNSTKQPLPIIGVEFAGETLECVQDGEEVWVNLRRACEGIGIDFAGQLTKLKTKEWATMCNISTVGLDGKLRDMTMLPIEVLPMWLGTLDTSRVPEEMRDTLIRFQKEAARALRNHYGGSKEELSPLDRLEIQLEAMEQREAMLHLEDNQQENNR